MATHMTLTSPFGRFVFEKTVPLSHAKLIRDSVVGQILKPKDGVRLRNSRDIYQFVQNRCGNMLAAVEFEWSIV